MPSSAFFASVIYGILWAIVGIPWPIAAIVGLAVLLVLMGVRGKFWFQRKSRHNQPAWLKNFKYKQP